jgi:hypothetical protein
MVGARGFEPPTPRSRTVCATRLRYAPRSADDTIPATLAANGWLTLRDRLRSGGGSVAAGVRDARERSVLFEGDRVNPSEHPVRGLR